MIQKTGMVLFLVLSVIYVNAQINSSFKERLLFANYLYSNNLLDECALYLKQSISISDNSDTETDSLYMKLGEVYKEKNMIDSAINCFNHISASTPLFSKSRIHKGMLYASNRNYHEAIIAIEEINDSTSEIKSAKQLLHSGISLLMRDTTMFRKTTSCSNDASTEFVNAGNKLNELFIQIKRQKKKSGFVAGALSALVPGAGKIYSGKTRQGISAFFPVALMAAQAYESYKVGGINSPRFYIYSGLFSVFYIGNIWGSVLSVSVARREFNKEIDEQILFNMRIPVRGIFR